MNTFAEQPLKRLNWPLLVMVTLGFWLSASLVIDLVMMPSMMATGMITQAGFIDAGYLIFGVFNHLELLCAALVLSGCFVLTRYHHLSALQERISLIFAASLLAIALFYTYGLTPALSSLGFEMTGFNGTARLTSPMLILHGIYWGLEVLKLGFGLTLLRWFYRNNCSLV